MKTLTHHLIRIAAALTVMGLTALTSSAQTFPNKPLKLVVPYAAGGSTDQFMTRAPTLRA
jgi:tripartite-type tricarboxylate transporter receptor subunit TctC